MKSWILALALVLLGLVEPSFTQNDRLENYILDDSDISVANYTLLQTRNNQTYTVYTLNMTTIRWFNASFSSAPIWSHIVTVSVPVNLNSSQPILFYISAGNNDDTVNNGQNTDLLAQISPACQCVTVAMGQIPNQPITFSSDPQQEKKIEDAIVAWTFNEWVKNRNNYLGSSADALPLLAPMTKAAKRGMDLTLEFLDSLNVITSREFVASGSSKRGWTSVLITAVDNRIIANIPIVFDFFNINEALHQQYQKFGGAYSFVLYDYWSQNITRNIDSIDLYGLAEIVDPISYMKKFQNKPFMFVLGSTDEFMMHWNTYSFWRELGIQTDNKAYMRRLANTNHYLDKQGPALAATVTNFMYLLSQSNPATLPKVQWDFVNNATHGAIEVKMSNLGLFNSFQISGLLARSVSNKRLYTLGPDGNPLAQAITWQTQLVSSQLNNVDPIREYKYTYAIPRDSNFTRYTAFYVQVAFNFKQFGLTSQISESQLFTVTTETNIIPEFDPGADCHGSQCLGFLV